MESAFYAVISGRVQMVMFRDFAARHARALHIVGEVQNMTDGTVRAHAEGEKEKLDSFIVFLKKGPMFARVDDVQVHWVHPSGVFETFSIHY